MNSRQRRKFEAQQHNDKLRYEQWLKANAIYNRPTERFLYWQKARQAGLTRAAALVFAAAMTSLGANT